MQEASAAVEREARYRLPRLLAGLLDEPAVDVERSHAGDAIPADLMVRDSHGRMLMMQVKNSSRPGQVTRAAEQLLAYADANVIPVLVVPFMSRAGAETADRVRLNWVDLSGNAHIRAPNLHVAGAGGAGRAGSGAGPAGAAGRHWSW